MTVYTFCTLSTNKAELEKLRALLIAERSKQKLDFMLSPIQSDEEVLGEKGSKKKAKR